MKFETFVNLVKQAIVSLFFLGLLVYSLQIAAFAFDWSWTPQFMRSPDEVPYLFALPICAIAAFAIVCVLDQFAPATKDSSGKMEFKAFGLAFSGPAGPITLWIACYLTLVVSMRLIKH
jgi:hypothetical protein